MMSRKTKSLIDKINQYKIDQNNCWIWQGPKHHDGYGSLYHNRKNNRAHRMVYEFYVAPIEKGKVLCHKCDNIICVNPDHMFVGTQSDNVRDCVNKGRNSNYRGWAGRPKAKLTIADVKHIRSCDTPNAELARKYNVKLCTIREVRTYKSWKGI